MEYFTVIGIEETIYVDYMVDGENCKFTYTPEIFKKHKIFLSNKKRVSCISLQEFSREGGSGWVPAHFSQLTYTYNVEKLPSFTHIPKDHSLTMKWDPNFADSTFESDVFEFNENGVDECYPSGFYTINFDLFKITPRYKDKRIVYIFTGKSCIGKTFLTSKLDDSISVYETDNSDNLPEVIIEDVIVVGARVTFPMEEVKAKIFQPAEIVMVNME